jgi:hypothetical protein
MKLSANLYLPAAKLLLLVAVVISPAAAQQNDQQTTKAPSKPRHVYTNDDLKGTDSQSGDALPQIPGLVKCGTDLKCFLQALDTAALASVTRNETVEQGTGVLTSNSIWWITRRAAAQCEVSFRVNAFEAKVNEKVAQGSPKSARDAVEAKIAEMNRDFEAIRGATGTCTLAVKDLKALMTSPAWSLMSLGPASNFGKNCSGPAFDTLRSSSLNGRK